MKAPGEGLPAVVVDEIYRLLPALVIATVDKFAQMPWNGVTQTLFGKVSGYCKRHGFRSPDLDDTDYHRAEKGYSAAWSACPPDLVIQDELHLISGPLGSLVGSYETAVDYLATWQIGGRAVRPKVIASTATIRNARLQVYKTFRREVRIFPPHAVDIEDNFVAREANLNTKPGRLYVGVCALSRRLKSVLIRVYIAYMAGGIVALRAVGKSPDRPLFDHSRLLQLDAKTGRNAPFGRRRYSPGSVARGKTC